MNMFIDILYASATFRESNLYQIIFGCFASISKSNNMLELFPFHELMNCSKKLGEKYFIKSKKTLFKIYSFALLNFHSNRQKLQCSSQWIY